MIAKTMQWDQSCNKLEFSLKIKKHAVPQSLNVWSVMHVYLGELEYEYLEGRVFMSTIQSIYSIRVDVFSFPHSNVMIVIVQHQCLRNNGSLET